MEIKEKIIEIKKDLEKINNKYVIENMNLDYDDCLNDFINEIDTILKKHGLKGYDISNLLGEGLYDYSAGQTLTYRNDKNIYIDIYVNVQGFGHTTHSIYAKIYRIYSYDYDDNDNIIVHFCYKVYCKNNDIVLYDCTDEIKEEF